MGQADDALLSQLLEQWFELRESGASTDLDDICKHQPHLAGRLRALVDREASANHALSSFGLGPAMNETQLGDFRIIDKIGAGGMATVYRAKQLSLGRDVALKVLSPNLAADASARARFLREAEITAALDHPNIVPIIAIGEQGDLCYLAMKLLSGPSLEALPSPMSAKRGAEIGIAIASALEEAHSSGVVHRDLKPANIILDGEIPYLVDFGLARSADHLTLTRVGVVPGTLAYMPPEQLSPTSRRPDARSDIYSLGAALYETVTGRAPLGHGNPSELMKRIECSEPRPLGLSAIHQDLETIILRTLDKDPSRRFPSSAELALELSRFARGDTILTLPSGRLTRLARKAARRPRTTAGISVGIVVLLALLGISVWQSWTEQRSFLARSRTAESALRELKLETGDALLAQLSIERADDPRIQELFALRHSAEALVTLLDCLQGRAFVLSDIRIRHVLDRAVKQQAERCNPRLTHLGIAVAHLFLGETDNALERIRNVEKNHGVCRGTRTLTAVARGEDVTQLLGHGDDAIGDGYSFVFAALALRLVPRPVEEIERELGLALQRDFGNLRAMYGLGISQSEKGDHQAAWFAMRSLIRDGELRPSVLLALAAEEMNLGRFEEADRHLEMLGSSRPMLRALARIRIHELRGDSAKLVHASIEASKRWPNDPSICFRAAEAYFMMGNNAKAKTLLEQADAGFRWPPIRASVRLALLNVRYASELPAGADMNPTALSSTQQLVADELIGSAEEILSSCTDERVRMRVNLFLSRVLRLRGRVKESWPPLLRALEAKQPENDAILRYGLLTLTRTTQVRNGLAENPDDISATAPVWQLIGKTRDLLSRLIHPPNPALVIAPETLELALIAEALLAESEYDSTASHDAAVAAIALMQDRGASDNDANHVQMIRIRDEVRQNQED